MINITGGKFRRKKIDVPLDKVRPTSTIKREAIFSILESYAYKNSFELYRNKCFIDLFAGSGALGLEAISRGGSFTYFYEINNEVLKILSKNCKNICKKNEYKITCNDVTKIKKLKTELPLSVIFLDPPYNLNLFKSVLKKIINNNILEKNSIIVLETDKKNKIEFSNQIEIIKQKIYGKSKIIFLKKLN